METSTPRQHFFVQMSLQMKRAKRARWMLTFIILTREFNRLHSEIFNSDNIKLDSLTCFAFNYLRVWCNTRTPIFASDCVLDSSWVGQIWLDKNAWAMVSQCKPGTPPIKNVAHLESTTSSDSLELFCSSFFCVPYQLFSSNLGLGALWHHARRGRRTTPRRLCHHQRSWYWGACSD